MDDAAFAGLPPPQRLAIDRVLLRANADGPVTDQRAVGAAFLSVVQRLAEESPVVVAIDDLQWIDPENLGTPSWADRARAELVRASGVRTRDELTASERQVAELAATGATNREMAAALFISPKTVETNLSGIYRKVGIRSRAELGRIMGTAGR